MFREAIIHSRDAARPIHLDRILVVIRALISWAESKTTQSARVEAGRQNLLIE